MLQVTRLTIGHAADQHIHIEHPDVAPRHAALYSLFGRLRVRALGSAPVIVNGKQHRRAWLSVGDVMTFGVARLTVEQRRPDGVVVLRLNDPHALSASRAASPRDWSLKGAGLDPRSWSWWLVLSVLGLGFLVPLAGALVVPLRPALRAAAVLPSDALWLPGPLHASHRAIGNDCNVCHTAPFERVDNRACAACHRTVQHHVAATSPDARLFAGRQCADCHLEHDAQKTLIDRNSAGCTACHADLRSLKPDTHLPNVANFSRSHPDFSLTLLAPVRSNGETAWTPATVLPAGLEAARQESNLAFSHKVHLDAEGIDSPTGRQRLSCAGCHQADAGGRFMAPIRMETHCAGCHTLQFDENDPASTVPHGDLPRMFKALREHFSRKFLEPNAGRGGPAKAARRRPGDELQILSREEQRRALAWTDTETAAAARELLEKRVCVECHKITKNALREAGPDQWRVAPVRLTQHWFPGASFSHAAHKTSECTACHQHVESAADSASIQMPRISKCRECHADDDARKVVSTCVMCHDFHRPERGPFSDADRHDLAERRP
ncbi:MAG: FHA domain-containing protein [Pseudomonadota bacterium]|nr:FHA domain-containing protein [Pseudomonadota bacterium]